ncbi:MAG: periplasmic heavy metal sensor [Pseudodonghicola sp.]
MTMTDTDRKPPRMRPWLRVLLGVSLALNLLVAGLAVGAAIRFGGGPERVRPPMPLGALLYRELPREDRKTLRDRNLGAREERAARRRADAEELNAALRAVPFDQARIEAFLTRDAARQAGLEEAMRHAWLARVAAMSDADRAAYADRLQQAMAGQNRPAGKEASERH